MSSFSKRLLLCSQVKSISFHRIDSMYNIHPFVYPSSTTSLLQTSRKQPVTHQANIYTKVRMFNQENKNEKEHDSRKTSSWHCLIFDLCLNFKAEHKFKPFHCLDLGSWNPKAGSFQWRKGDIMVNLRLHSQMTGGIQNTRLLLLLVRR